VSASHSARPSNRHERGISQSDARLRDLRVATSSHAVSESHSAIASDSARERTNWRGAESRRWPDWFPPPAIAAAPALAPLRRPVAAKPKTAGGAMLTVTPRTRILFRPSQHRDGNCGSTDDHEESACNERLSLQSMTISPSREAWR